ncbi:MAG: ChaN family lipoprotein [Nitrospirae bacterium]|nr:ChaN family lipoprotein [Nitrospirota bacterium]MCL5976660.1 ChaN family lipoprotein [Nitrospirota bacterium]
MIIITFLFLPAITHSGQSPEYNLEVAFDIHNSKIAGIARIDVSAGKELVIHAGELKITDLSLNQQKIQPDVRNGILKILPHQNGALIIRYEGVFKDNKAVYDTNYGAVSSIIDDRGISLTGIWYPQADGLYRYKLRAILPKGYEAVSEAESIIKNTKNGNAEFIFEFPHPVDGINLIATNKYDIIKDSFNGIEIYAYFFKEDIELAKQYIEYTKKYLKMYEAFLGKYPYKRFSIVENFLPTGYSMPSYTLLGRDVVRLPFIVETSLGHEILHQWFGNLVYIDYEKGNWAEGLTTYLADHLYEERKGKGWEYRKQSLIDYGSYVNEKNELPVRKFAGRIDFSSKAIGYGKTAMIFHMLKNITGEDIFYRSLRDIIKEKSFKKASWDDLRVIFERNYGKDMQWFFRQWVDIVGIPDIYVESSRIKQGRNKYEFSFDIGQRGRVYAIDVPLTIYYSDGFKKKVWVRADKVKTGLTLSLASMPEKIIMDEDYDIARKLSNDEIPPVIARLLGDEKIIIVFPISNREAYKAVIDSFKERGAVEKESKDIGDSDIKSSSLVVLGGDNPLIERLYGKPEIIDSGFSIVIKKNPWNSNKVTAIINGRSKEEVDAAFRKIFHYGKYSLAAFDKGRNIDKKIAETQRGIKVENKEDTMAVDLSAIKALSDVIEAVSAKKIVYIGEYHDRFAHHNVQLELIKGLHKKHKKIAVGMEMFQRPFQKVLDDYIAGGIDEREFLKSSEYFKRWGFDYNLYKPILDFARQEKIPVIALNIRREIVDKVSKSGIDALSGGEKNEIPLQMDFSDNEYRERLKKIFEMHGRSKERNFDFFYQSQILWDETMSMSVDEFMKKNPDYRMVVLAGGGHLQHGSGIPKRTFRRNGYDYATILNDVDIERNIADYIIFPKPLDGASAPKLMVLLKEDNGKVAIDGFAEDSVAEKAGLTEGDIILSLDGIDVSKVDDIKLHLFYKKKGDTVKVKILRKRFLFGDKEMEFDVTL